VCSLTPQPVTVTRTQSQSLSRKALNEVRPRFRLMPGALGVVDPGLHEEAGADDGGEHRGAVGRGSCGRYPPRAPHVQASLKVRLDSADIRHQFLVSQVGGRPNAHADPALGAPERDAGAAAHHGRRLPEPCALHGILRRLRARG
jgi:hypothetical protein